MLIIADMMSYQHTNSLQKGVNSMQTRQIPLSHLRPGQEGVVVRLGAKGPLKRRLLDMGVVRGETIAVVRVAPLGDPVEFMLKGYSLSLRKKDAEQILVEVKGAQ
jgi:ferrous iron transport protein A